MPTTIQPLELAETLRNSPGVILIDVRTPVEFRELHLEGAQNVPLDQLDAASLRRALGDTADQPIFVICRSGGRGRQACDTLERAGIPHVANIEGGTLACVEAGLPVVRGKKAISLERQVRIAAGLLVVLGVVLGAVVHPGFFALSAFVGAGLIFAGVTDTCGMGLLLARMPWNRIDRSSRFCHR